MLRVRDSLSVYIHVHRSYLRCVIKYLPLVHNTNRSKFALRFFPGPDQQQPDDDDNNMIVLHAAFAALLLVHSSVADAGLEEQVPVQSDEGVLVLTKDNFDNIIATSEYLLVKFCEYCPP